VTAHATGAGLDTEALDRLRAAIEGDIDAGLYDGAVVMLGRHGELGLHEAIGWAERDTGRETQTDDIFRVLSLTKAFTNTLTQARARNAPCHRGHSLSGQTSIITPIAAMGS